jgi:hypothetical protein
LPHRGAQPSRCCPPLLTPGARPQASYGDDISRPAATSREAVQWVYYAYLGAVKEQDGAAMSLGRVDAFLDTYFERDLAEGRISEPEVQELVDQFVMKLRIVRWGPGAVAGSGGVLCWRGQLLLLLLPCCRAAVLRHAVTCCV